MFLLEKHSNPWKVSAQKPKKIRPPQDLFQHWNSPCFCFIYPGIFHCERGALVAWAPPATVHQKEQPSPTLSLSLCVYIDTYIVQLSSVWLLLSCTSNVRLACLDCVLYLFLHFWTLLVCQIGQDFSPWVQCIKKFAWLNPHCLDIMSSYCCCTSYIYRTLTSMWRKWVALDTGVIMS